MTYKNCDETNNLFTRRISRTPEGIPSAKHPNETLSSIVQEALEVKLVHKDVSKLLALAGVVQNAPCHAIDHAEDYDVRVNGALS